MKKKWVLARISEDGSIVFVNSQSHASSEINKAETHNNKFFQNSKYEEGFRPLMIIVTNDGERFIPL